MFVAIVPAYNEEKRIGSVVQSLFEHVDRVVVVDDASVDNTSPEARKAGAALETVHAYAREVGADFVLHFDGDAQFDVGDIKPALERLKKEGADILFGSRFLGVDSNMPWFKKNILSPVGRMVNNFFGAVRVSDAHNGFRILNKKALGNIQITQDRMAHATEILTLTKQKGLKHTEFPVKVTYHEYGQRASNGFHIIKDLVFGKFIK